MSELSSTVSENLPLLLSDKQILNHSTMKDMVKLMTPLAKRLKLFHKESDRAPTEDDTRKLLVQIVQPRQELATLLNRCVELGGALFSIGVNLKVAQALIANPDKYAQMITFAPHPEPVVKQSQNVLDLIPLFCPLAPAPESASFSTSIGNMVSLLQTGQCTPLPERGTLPDSQPSSSSQPQAAQRKRQRL